MLYYLIRVFFTYYPSSKVVKTYAANVKAPLGSRLTPLRLAYYVYLLVLSSRLILNSIFRKTYHQYDLPVYLAELTFTHHMVGLAVLPCIGLAFVYDYAFVLKPHPAVAPMLSDLLQSQGNVIK